jgi:hypothetical protein
MCALRHEDSFPLTCRRPHTRVRGHVMHAAWMVSAWQPSAAAASQICNRNDAGRVVEGTGGRRAPPTRCAEHKAPAPGSSCGPDAQARPGMVLRKAGRHAAVCKAVTCALLRPPAPHARACPQSQGVAQAGSGAGGNGPMLAQQQSVRGRRWEIHAAPRRDWSGCVVPRVRARAMSARKPGCRRPAPSGPVGHPSVTRPCKETEHHASAAPIGHAHPRRAQRPLEGGAVSMVIWRRSRCAPGHTGFS